MIFQKSCETVACKVRTVIRFFFKLREKQRYGGVNTGGSRSKARWMVSVFNAQ